MRCIDGDSLFKDICDSINKMTKIGICVDGEWLWAKLNDALENAPTVEPEPQWIPCCETVDIPDHEILACDKYGEMMFGYLAYEDDQWLCASDGEMMYDPIAWREKPEPYRKRR